MTSEQLETFIYSCLSFANTAHFDNERFVKDYLDKGLSESTFNEVILRNYKIANYQHFGVCFTMTCWAYYLLYTMGITSGYYILDSVEKKTGFPNYALLYKSNGEYHICDLAAQIRLIEEVHKDLFHIGRNIEYYENTVLDEAIKKLANPKYINQSIEEYSKEYYITSIIDASGIDDDRVFTEIPEISLMDFLNRNKDEISLN